MPIEKTYDLAGNLLAVNGNRWNSQQAFEELVDTVGEGGTGTGGISIVDKGADPTGETDSVGAIEEAIAEAITEGTSVYIPPGEYKLSRTPGTNYALALTDLSDLLIWGVDGLSVLRAEPDIADGFGECKLIKITGCRRLTLRGLTIDGGWENAHTAVSILSNNVELPEATINVWTTVGFDDAGTFELINEDGAHLITYTGKTATSFTGCSGGTGFLRTHNDIVKFTRGQSNRTVALASNGVDMAVTTELTLHGDISAWPASVSGDEVAILTTVGVTPTWHYLKYTSKSGQVLQGVTGVTGTVVGADDGNGSAVRLIQGQGGQQASNPQYAQVDPRNHSVFIYGDDGFNNAKPNYDITLDSVSIINAYGDGVWVGQRSTRTTLNNVLIELAARNGVTFTSYANGVRMVNVKVFHSGTTPVDAEPVEGPVTDVDGIGIELIPWPNQGTVNPNVVLSAWGGSETRPAEHNLAQNWRFVNSIFRFGSVYLANVKHISFDNCSFDNNLTSDVAISTAPLLIERYAEDVRVTNCVLDGRRSSASSSASGTISIIPYRQGINAATVPGNVLIEGCYIIARDDLAGVFIEAVGGYDGFSGTVSGYTGASAPSTPALLQFSGTPFAGMDDYFIGRQVLLGGALANIIGNDENTLELSPVAENYVVGNVWTNRNGDVVDAPAATGTAHVLPVGGFIKVRNCTIDCGQKDDSGPGGNGIRFYTSSTFDEGYNQLRIGAYDNVILSPTGAGIQIDSVGNVNPGVHAELELVDNTIRDDQGTKTCTAGLGITNPDIWQHIRQHGNTATPGIPLLDAGWDSVKYYLSSSAYPPTYTGSVNPNSLVYAPKQASFAWLDANSTLRKQSAEPYNTGWVEVKTTPYIAYRGKGLLTGTTTASLTVDNSGPVLIEDIQILQVTSVDPAVVAFSENGGFVEIDSVTSTHFSATLRTTWYWRRYTAGAATPVITTDNVEAQMFMFRDCIATGDPVDVSATGNNTGGSLAVSIAGPTSTVDGALMVTLLCCFTGSGDSSFGDLACDEPAVLELNEEADACTIVGSDKFTTVVITGRRTSAGDMGTVSGNITSVSGYSFTMGITLALKPLES